MIRSIHTIAAVLALCGAAVARPALAQSKPITPPDPIDATSNTIVSESSMWSMTSTEDGRTFKIESKNGVISAEIDGKPVPADRIVHEGDTVRINDEKGESLFQSRVPSAGGISRSISVSPFGRSLGGTHIRPLGSSGDRMIRVEAAAVPPVMIGVQLLEPDASIRGHLGLKENEATMVSAVYEGLPAALAGLEPYDVIVAVDGKSPAAPAAVRKALRDTAAGKSISLKVIHRGQEKTVAVTPEKYDHDKLDKAKISAIAAVSAAPGASAIASTGDPDMDLWVGRALGGGVGGQSPFIATAPSQHGKPMTIWLNNTPGAAGQSMDDFTKRMQAMAEKMQAQAEAARRDAERLHQQLLNQAGAAPAPGAANPGMDDRMKKMEEMLQKLMDQREKKADEKSDARSGIFRTTRPAEVCFS